MFLAQFKINVGGSIDIQVGDFYSKYYRNPLRYWKVMAIWEIIQKHCKKKKLREQSQYKILEKFLEEIHGETPWGHTFLK